MARLLGAIPGGWRTRWASRGRRVHTVLAPALPALVLVAFTTAGTVEAPLAGLKAQLHVTAVTAAVTAR